MVAKIVDRRRGQHQVGGGLAQNFNYAASRAIVAKDAEIAELRAAVFGPNTPGGLRGLLAADSGDFLGRVVAGAAVSWRHRDDHDTVSGARKLCERATSQDLDIIGMSVDCKNGFGH